MTTPYYSDDRAALYRGDALQVLAALPSGSVDAVVSDPPYSSGGMVRGDRMQGTHAKYVQSDSSARDNIAAFSGDNRDQRAYAYWSALWMGEALRTTKPGGIILAFTDWRQLPSTADAIQAGGWIWRGIVPWVKPNARPQSGRFTAQAEYVAWGSNGPLPVDYSAAVLPGFYQASPPREREHITQKPVDVMRSLVKICPEDGTVLDPFMGSGTTGVAAMLERRRFIGVEMVDDHAATAERRIREAQGQAVPRGDQDVLDLGATA
ncbi:DNA-methyltransferase [Oerskovia enterophila]|uniref:Methyltransferase n=1 Tax=Oerskovia enterophila TaxID=43678 RepID=A0ABX2Y3E5_9CELL|nr:site-specific DNA-methyltransferase [Oerskovia enterophila]OCI31067.1 modification methylase DpnIIB [Oerskovia enterophila]